MRTWLKQIREQQNLTTAEIGNLSGISQSYYSLIENGMRGNPLNVDVAKRIEELKRQRTEIEQFVFTLPNSKLRRIATLRAIQGLSWRSVAAKMGHKYSEDTVRKKYSEIFK